MTSQSPYTPVGKALLPGWVAEEARKQGNLLELSTKVRAALGRISTHNLRRLIRAARAARNFSDGREVLSPRKRVSVVGGVLTRGREAEGVFIPLGTMCGEYQARLQAEAERLAALPVAPVTRSVPRRALEVLEAQNLCDKLPAQIVRDVLGLEPRARLVRDEVRGFCVVRIAQPIVCWAERELR